jgi:hypothetical protein
MNLKWNLNIKFLFVAIDFNENHIKNYGWHFFSNGLIMDFEMMALCLPKLWIQILWYSSVKIIYHHQMRNLRLKWLNFFHYKKFSLNFFFDFHHFLFIFPFYIEMSKLSHIFLTNHMVTKSIRENYRIYSLIIIIIVEIITNVKCRLFKMSKVIHLIVFLPCIIFHCFQFEIFFLS